MPRLGQAPAATEDWTCAPRAATPGSVDRLPLPALTHHTHAHLADKAETRHLPVGGCPYSARGLASGRVASGARLAEAPRAKNVRGNGRSRPSTIIATPAAATGAKASGGSLVRSQSAPPIKGPTKAVP